MLAAALSIFGVPPVVTVIAAWILMGTMVLQGRYWTWEKVALVFCALNLIYIPAAFMINPPVDKILHGSLIPQLPQEDSPTRCFHVDGQLQKSLNDLNNRVSVEWLTISLTPCPHPLQTQALAY